MIVFTANDYKILKAILDRNNEKKGLCKSNGTTIDEIKSKTELSVCKVRQTIRKFVEMGFIEQGLTIVKTKTYVLTPIGFQELMNLQKNIFGEV